MLWMSSGRKAMEAPGCTVNSRARRSEEHTSELQSQSNLVCRLLISEEHTSELQSQSNLVCRLLLEKKKRPAHQLLPWPPLSPRSQRTPQGRSPHPASTHSTCLSRTR